MRRSLWCRNGGIRQRTVCLVVSLFLFALISLDLACAGPLSTASRELSALMGRHHCAWLDRTMVLVTTLGDSLLLGAVTLVLALFLYINRARAFVPRLFLVFLVLLLAVHLTKMMTAVPRPRPLYGGVSRWAFPSSHAAMSLFVYGQAARICLPARPGSPGWIVGLGMTFLCILAIGFSRIYLGAHWPVDVLAGFCLGLAGMAVLPPLSPELAADSRSIRCGWWITILIILHAAFTYPASVKQYFP